MGWGTLLLRPLLGEPPPPASSEPPHSQARARLTPLSCASRRAPGLRGDEHRHRQHRHGVRSQHGECPPSGGCPETLRRRPAQRVHRTGPEASSAGAQPPGSEAPASCACSYLRPPGGRGAIAAARRVQPPRGRKGSPAGLALGWPRRWRLPAPPAPGSRFPGRLLSNRRRGAGKQARAVGVARMLGEPSRLPGAFGVLLGSDAGSWRGPGRRPVGAGCLSFPGVGGLSGGPAQGRGNGAPSWARRCQRC